MKLYVSLDHALSVHWNRPMGRVVIGMGRDAWAHISIEEAGELIHGLEAALTQAAANPKPEDTEVTA